MKKQLWKKSVTAVILATAIAMTFTACGGKRDGKKASVDTADNKVENTVKKNTGEEDYIYQASFQNIGVSFDVANVCMHEGRVYMIGSEYQEGKKKDSYSYKAYLVSCKLDGSDVKKSEVKLKETEYVQYFDMDGENQLRLLVTLFTYDEKTQESKSKDYIYTMDVNGKIKEKCEVKKKNDDFYIRDAILSEDMFLAVSGSKVYTFDMKGKQGKVYELGRNIEDIVQTEDGKVYVYTYYDDSYMLKELNMESGDFKEVVRLDFYHIYNVDMHAGKGKDIYINDTNNVYRLNLGTGEITTLFNWINSNINSNDVRGYFPAEDGRFVVVNSVYEKNNTRIELATLKKENAANIKEKTILKLSCAYMEDGIKNNILSFNKNNKNYQIEVKDYSGYEDPAAQLNLDITSGDIPDILSMNSLPVSQYIKKDLLADLYPLMEKDKEISKEDFIESVINAIEKDGKLYYMGAAFTVRGLIGSKKNLKDIESWTLDDMKKLYDNMPENGVFMPGISRQLFIQNILGNQMERYVNWNTGEVTFDSGDFIKILEFAKSFPDEEEMEEEARAKEQANVPVMVQKGRLMLDDFYLLTLDHIQMYTKMYKKAGGFELLGYPSSENNDSLFMSFDDAALAITEKCSDKEGAWEFMRLFLTYDTQKTTYYYLGLPTRKDALEKQLEHAMATEQYTDDEGTEVYPISEIIGWDGYTVELGPLSEEEVSLIRSMIGRVGKCISYDSAAEEICKIIMEEAKAFFAGDKTAQETAQVIQSRVKIYVSENS